MGSLQREQSCVVTSSNVEGSPLGPQKPYPLEESKAEVRKDRVSWSKLDPFVDLVSLHCRPGLCCLMGGPGASLSEGHGTVAASHRAGETQ